MARKRRPLTKGDIQQIVVGLAEIQAIYSRRIMPLMNRFRAPIQDKIQKKLDAFRIAYDIENDVCEELGDDEGLRLLHTYRNELAEHIGKLPVDLYEDFPFR